MDKDGILLIDENSNEQVIYNGATFKKLIKGIIVEYAKKTEEEANGIIARSRYFSKPISSFKDAIFFSHETEYHWAMLMTYGDQYWLKGISSEPPEGYDEWESNYIAENDLAEFSFEW